MNLSEFKAWFEGFTDGIDSNPNEKQWAKIKEKVSTIRTDPTSPVVIREYWNTYRRWWNEPVWYDRFVPYAGWGCAVARNKADTTSYNAQLSAVGSHGAGINFETFAANTLDDRVHGHIEPVESDGRIVLATFRAMGAADAAAIQ